jgi:hypothetical protein
MIVAVAPLLQSLAFGMFEVLFQQSWLRGIIAGLFMLPMLVAFAVVEPTRAEQRALRFQPKVEAERR